jgi:hypothetical protein
MKDMRRAALLGIVAAAAACAGCGVSSDRAAPGETVRIEAATHTATLHLGSGRRVLRFRLREESGVILLYRLRAPRGVRVRGSGQIPGLTVPLLIATRPVGPSSSCVARGPRVVCTVGEEWCPMPRAAWHFRVEKLGGPPADVSVTFRVGTPGASL